MAINEGALYEHLSHQVRVRREARGLTQDELAQLTEVARTSINNIEKQRQKPPLYLLYRIAEALDVEVADLLPGLTDVSQQALVEFQVHGEVHRVQPKTANALERAFAVLSGD
jgi:transcriptional regulator with XRE-family HTH domain